ncbi:MAG: hypothetical protein SWK90_00525 [Chloroflexota bacterium]|nr:hypothetical protein [Chloroflexota bacterium]
MTSDLDRQLAGPGQVGGVVVFLDQRSGNTVECIMPGAEVQLTGCFIPPDPQNNRAMLVFIHGWAATVGHFWTRP